MPTHPSAVLRAVLGAIMILAPAGLSAQATTGRIVGKVFDASTGNPLADAGVQVVGTTIGTMSGVGGRFTVTGIPAGTVTLTVRRIGYAPKTVTGLQLAAGQTLEQDVALGTVELKLQTIVVTSDKERGSVAAALDAQRNATGLVNQVTAEQIAKSPDGDAAAAAQRVSGVSVQDGKFLFVRGLGERYTTASLNGARLPSPEPERKVVPLDLFPSGVLQSITTSKTFTPDLQGDFSGAQVDIRTREFPSKRQVTYSLGFGMNQSAAFRDVLRAPTAGGEYMGMGAATRAMPSALAGANFMGTISAAQNNAMVLSMRNVWTPVAGTGLPNTSFGASVGGSDPVFGRQVGYLLSGSYSLAQEVRADEVNGTVNLGPNGTTAYFDGPLTGRTGRVTAQWGGIANFSTLVGRNFRLAWNNTFNRQGDNEARQDAGRSENYAAEVTRSTLRYVERSIWSSQLAAEQQAGRHALEYSVTVSGSSRGEPDRADLVRLEQAGPRGEAVRPILAGSLDGARRLYFSLWEENAVAQFHDKVSIGSAGRDNALKFGVYGRATRRASEAPIFALTTSSLPADVLARAAEQVFTSAYACATCANFVIQPIGQSGSYTANDQTAAGYGMVDLALGSRTRVITGARVEYARIAIDAETQLGARFPARLRNVDVLPSLVVNTKLSENAALRMAVSQTLARPEYRELAPILFRDVLGGMNLSGNASLQRTLIQNADVRWEWFPSAEEVLSAGVFFKNFVKPIERVEVATSGSSQQTFVNADGAVNYGLELEVRKRLSLLGTWAEAFTASSNVTLMQSRIRIGERGGISQTNPNRAMVGQAPYVVNAGLTWQSRNDRATATLLYNRVGRRIFAAGPAPLPDMFDEARDIVDLSLRTALTSRVSLRLDAKNLFDARFRITQGTTEREAFNSGRVFQAGFTWRA